MNIKETRCIDASIRYLESRLDSERTFYACPEDDAAIPINMRIDASFGVGTRKFALEHTMIEPYEGHIKTAALARKAESYLRSQLKGLRFPVGVDVALPSNWHELSSRNRDREAFLRQVAKLIWKEKLTIGKMPDNHRLIDIGSIDGIKITVGRNSFEKIENGEREICLVPMVADYESGRQNRIERSLRDKLPKLKEWSNGYELVLVLENNDISLTNESSIIGILKQLWENENLIPCNFVFYINTSHSTWRLCPIVFDGGWHHTKDSGLLRIIQYIENDLLSNLI